MSAAAEPRPTPVASRRVEIAVALAIGLFVIALWMPLMNLPLERDEGGYAFIAWRMSHGEMPYADFFTQKPPGSSSPTTRHCAWAGIRSSRWG